MTGTENEKGMSLRECYFYKYGLITIFIIVGLSLGLINTFLTDKKIDIASLPVTTVFIMNSVPDSREFNSCMIVEKDKLGILFKCRGEAPVRAGSLILKKITNRITLPEDEMYWRWKTYHSSIIALEYFMYKTEISEKIF